MVYWGMGKIKDRIHYQLHTRYKLSQDKMYFSSASQHIQNFMFSMNCITFNLNLHQRNQKLKQLSSEVKEEGLRINPVGRSRLQSMLPILSSVAGSCSGPAQSAVGDTKRSAEYRYYTHPTWRILPVLILGSASLPMKSDNCKKSYLLHFYAFLYFSSLTLFTDCERS